MSFFFFFNDTATTEIYTLSLHDALPISAGRPVNSKPVARATGLFAVIDGHLQLLAGPERRGDRRLDGDHLAGLGVPTLTRRALARLEIAEAGDLHFRTLLQLTRDDALVVEQGVDRTGRVGLGHLGPHGQRRGQLGFVHGCSL